MAATSYSHRDFPAVCYLSSRTWTKLIGYTVVGIFDLRMCLPRVLLNPVDLLIMANPASGGEYDPWITLSLLSEEPWAPKGVKLTQEIPEEGVSTGKGEVFGYLLKGAGHGWDLQRTVPESVHSRKIFTAALRKWLGCFKKRTT